MGIIVICGILLLALVFILPTKADPGKKVSPAGYFAIIFIVLGILIYFLNR